MKVENDYYLLFNCLGFCFCNYCVVIKEKVFEIYGIILMESLGKFIMIVYYKMLRGLKDYF